MTLTRNLFSKLPPGLGFLKVFSFQLAGVAGCSALRSEVAGCSALLELLETVAGGSALPQLLEAAKSQTAGVTDCWSHRLLESGQLCVAFVV